MIKKSDTRINFGFSAPVKIYFNKNFYFSNKSDPFLIHPSIKQAGYIQLPIEEDTLKKISQCRYFLLTEKISIYSLSDDISNIQDLLLETTQYLLKKEW